MIWLAIFIIIVFSIAAYLLLAPFYLEIDSKRGLYQIRFHRLASAKFSVANSSLIIDVQVAWWHKRIDLFAIKPRVKKVEAVTTQPEKKARKVSVRKMWRVLKSFKVNKCRVAIDFGDMALDGILFPLFYWWGRWSKKDIAINFTGDNEIVLEIENNFTRMLWAYFRP